MIVPFILKWTRNSADHMVQFFVLYGPISSERQLQRTGMNVSLVVAPPWAIHLDTFPGQDHCPSTLKYLFPNTIITSFSYGTLNLPDHVFWSYRLQQGRQRESTNQITLFSSVHFSFYKYSSFSYYYYNHWFTHRSPVELIVTVYHCSSDTQSALS